MKNIISRFLRATITFGIAPFAFNAAAESDPAVQTTVGKVEKTDKDAITAEVLNARLVTSKTTWLKLRTACKGNYEYDVVFSSFSGFTNTTTIVVKDNKVVERRYRECSNRSPQPLATGQDPSKVSSGGWAEKTTAELGKNKSGAPVKTIDDLYKEVAELITKGVQEHQCWMTLFDKNGVIQYFGCSDKRIMDDSPFSGAKISALRMEFP